MLFCFVNVVFSQIYNFNQRFSLELKYEYQELKKGINTYSELPTNMPSFTSNFLKDKQINRIISVGLGRSPLWSISLTMDYANTEERIIVDEVRNKNAIEEISSVATELKNELEGGQYRNILQYFKQSSSYRNVWITTGWSIMQQWCLPVRPTI